MSSTQIERIKATRTLEDVAQDLGLEVQGKYITPCPACHAERRGRNEHRGPITIYGHRWQCYACDASGDSIDMVRRRMDEPRITSAVLSWFDDGGDYPRRPRSEPKPKPPPRRPPGRVEFYESLVEVDDSEVPQVGAFLRNRWLDPAAVADRGGAKAIPGGTPGPEWARYGSRYQLVVPMWDAMGELASFRLRLVNGHGKKSLAPRGYEAGGCVFACGLGRQLLKHGKVPDWWPADVAFRLVVAEGEADLLTVMTLFTEADEYAPAVWGVVQGSWKPSIASRVPDGTQVHVATHVDPDGHKYAMAAGKSLRHRCDVRRTPLEMC